MFALKKLLSDVQSPADGPSVGERLRAWWDGYELEPGPKPPRNRRPRLLDTAGSGDDASGSDEGYPPLDKSTPWPDTRQQIAAMVWGDGFVVPGDAASTVELVQAFGLDSSSNMLEIGSGMGGGSRAIAAKFGAYVSGFDLEPELAAEATIQAEVHSLDRKAAGHPLDPDDAEFKPEFYAGALIRETLYRIADKKGLVRKVVESLKPGGHLVIIDLFFADEADASEMDRWRDGERSEAYGWEIDEAREVLGKLSIDIRTITDESEAYHARILDAWNSFVAKVARDPLPNDLVHPMVDEAEFWARRMAAIQSGHLKLHKLACIQSKPAA